MLTLLKRAKTRAQVDSKRSADASLGDLVDDMLAVSKCKDFVVNKGHYFGTSLVRRKSPA